MSTRQALASITFATFLSKPILSSPGLKRIHTNIFEFINRVPIYNIKRNKNFNNFELIHNFIKSNL